MLAVEIAMSNRSVPKFNNKIERDEFWLKVCQEFMSSGLSETAFCDKRKISDSSIYRWLGYFKDNPALQQADKPLHLPKKVSNPLSNKTSVKHNFLRVNVEHKMPIKITVSVQASPRVARLNSLQIINYRYSASLDFSILCGNSAMSSS